MQYYGNKSILRIIMFTKLYSSILQNSAYMYKNLYKIYNKRKEKQLLIQLHITC